MAKKPKARHDVILVEWFDAHDGPLAWVHTEEYEVEETLVQSVGFKVHEDDKYLTLATSDDGNKYIGGGIVIPKVNIVKKTKL